MRPGTRYPAARAMMPRSEPDMNTQLRARIIGTLLAASSAQLALATTTAVPSLCWPEPRLGSCIDNLVTAGRSTAGMASQYRADIGSPVSNALSDGNALRGHSDRQVAAGTDAEKGGGHPARADRVAASSECDSPATNAACARETVDRSALQPATGRPTGKLPDPAAELRTTTRDARYQAEIARCATLAGPQKKRCITGAQSTLGR